MAGRHAQFSVEPPFVDGIKKFNKLARDRTRYRSRDNVTVEKHAPYTNNNFTIMMLFNKTTEAAVCILRLEMPSDFIFPRLCGCDFTAR